MVCAASIGPAAAKTPSQTVTVEAVQKLCEEKHAAALRRQLEPFSSAGAAELTLFIAT
jgi:hypothetical protein